MRLFLVRHGQTALNRAGLLRGELDVPLDETGLEEAGRLGEAFAGIELDAVVSSPLVRALDTARPIAASTGAPLELDRRLRDRSYGKWAGTDVAELEQRFGTLDAAPGVERQDELAARVEAALLGATVTSPASSATRWAVALVTHDAVLRALLDRLLPQLDATGLELSTGSLSELRRDPPSAGWNAVRLAERPSGGTGPAPA